MMKRDIHITARDLLNAMQFREGDLGRIGILSGQPQRIEMCLEILENPIKNFSAFGYTLWTGEYKGKRITVGNGGMYAPDAALVTEIVCEGGVDVLIRLGSCGALKEEIDIGDLVIAEAALRGDGVTNYYVNEGFVPRAERELIEASSSIFDGKNVHYGTIWTTDALLRETKEIINRVIKEGAIGVDMVTSPFLTIANLYKRRALAILVVSDNLITGEMGFFDIRFFDAEREMVDKAFKLIEAIDA